MKASVVLLLAVTAWGLLLGGLTIWAHKRPVRVEPVPAALERRCVCTEWVGAVDSAP